MKYFLPLLFVFTACSCAHTQPQADDFYHVQVGEARFTQDPNTTAEPFICLPMDGMLTCVAMSEYLQALQASQSSSKQEL